MFAEDTARVLAGLGIKSYLAHRPWPTPTSAWAVTATNAAAGVMVTGLISLCALLATDIAFTIVDPRVRFTEGD